MYTEGNSSPKSNIGVQLCAPNEIGVPVSISPVELERKVAFLEYLTSKCESISSTIALSKENNGSFTLCLSFSGSTIHSNNINPENSIPIRFSLEIFVNKNLYTRFTIDTHDVTTFEGSFNCSNGAQGVSAIENLSGKLYLYDLNTSLLSKVIYIVNYIGDSYNSNIFQTSISPYNQYKLVELENGALKTLYVLPWQEALPGSVIYEKVPI